MKLALDFARWPLWHHSNKVMQSSMQLKGSSEASADWSLAEKVTGYVGGIFSKAKRQETVGRNEEIFHRQ